MRKIEIGKIFLITVTICILAFILVNAGLGSASYDFSRAVNELLQRIGIGFSEYILRKTAHLTEYGMLGVFLMLLFWKKKRRFLHVILCGAVVGTMDEMIQMMSSYRYPTVRDVFLDVIGIGTGAAVVVLIRFIKRYFTEKYVYFCERNRIRH